MLETASGASARVVPRWLLDFREKDWNAIVRSLTNEDTVDGWLITRTSARVRRIGVSSKYERKWVYALWYLKSYRQGTAASNSEDEVNVVIDAVTDAFEASEDLGIEDIDYHNGFDVMSIDTVDNQVHLVMAELTVTLTSQ